jgi:hypothetical protein
MRPDDEAAVTLLAAGDTITAVAQSVGATAESVDTLARHYGWPASLTRLRRASRLIGQGQGEQALAGAPALVAEPEGQPQPAAEATAPGAVHVSVTTGTATAEDIAAAIRAAVALPTPTVQEDDVPTTDPALAEADRILDVLDGTTGPTATLTTSLDVLLTADGTPVALTEAVVEVALDLDALQRALGGEDVSPVAVTRCESRLTDAGRALVRRLAALDAEG